MDFDDMEDERLAMEDPGVRCLVWGWRRAQTLDAAILAATLEELTERERKKFMRAFGKASQEVTQEFRDNPLEAPAWVRGEVD